MHIKWLKWHEPILGNTERFELAQPFKLLWWSPQSLNNAWEMEEPYVIGWTREHLNFEQYAGQWLLPFVCLCAVPVVISNPPRAKKK